MYQPVQRRAKKTNSFGQGSTTSFTYGSSTFSVVQRQAKTANQSQSVVHPNANRTGLPEYLRVGGEILIGKPMDDVTVDYNSAEPAKVNAQATAQGKYIKLAPGQEGHLEHEFGHTLQHMQGQRVQPTMQLGGVAINDDPILEKEATQLGAKAATLGKAAVSNANYQPAQTLRQTSSTVQDEFTIVHKTLSSLPQTPATALPDIVVQRARASDFLPDKLKFSTNPPYIKKGSEQQSQPVVEPRQEETQPVTEAQQKETQPVGATPVADNELILSSNPKDTNEESVKEFRHQVTKMLHFWGAKPLVADVRVKPILLGSQEKQAIILKWRPEWGTKPISTDLSSSLTAIDAKLAVAAVQQLEGWDKLDNTDRKILKNLIGGETNRLSETVRSKMAEEDFKALMAMNPEEQEGKLHNLITYGKFLPYSVEEPLTTNEKVEYTIDPLSERKEFKFKGKTADAKFWGALFEEKGGGSHSMTIIAPKELEPGYHNYTVQQIVDAVSYLPKENRSLVRQINFNPVPNPSNDRMIMSVVADGVVMVYPNKETKPLKHDDGLKGNLIHEIGHLWTVRDWGWDKSKGKWLEWKETIAADKVFVSEYAKETIDEDLAETFRAYSSTKGSPKFEEYRQIVPNRFAMLDREYR
ncbi:MAG: hypothetical protein CLLPBCKN_006880 [Chroococcidiopsis cubana SAG 39.79]|uniref:DUF4157 domain-containing protein n=1 Tax=Chroococcidiopsis cubana SAG 39.79 TaxID=388085 RepID=A0AB37UIL1_9CYAN|nr:hypothetical protein [Chroococcidiopsis cubana]MDZ4877445.1 hypothetical protein [Chroococcidiopsis cubana SAG 39.79]PSB65831.1 hypothetical protein C7B79_03700 [Chroococcidiopsis cubana CCALA 043]RUT11217.1 hypothetical protein DSM107010_34860 [Chroococcidiopsis cubana SAG 39.79]